MQLLMEPTKCTCCFKAKLTVPDDETGGTWTVDVMHDGKGSGKMTHLKFYSSLIVSSDEIKPLSKAKAHWWV